MRKDNLEIGVAIPSDVNLSLLIGVLKHIIGKENTTIIECNNIYNRFDLECRPIVVTEGQEIIRKLFEKVKHTIKPKQRETSKSRGRNGYFTLWAYDYKYNPKEVPFLTNAQMRENLEKACTDYYTYPRILFYKYDANRSVQQDLDLRAMREMIAERKKLYKQMQIEENIWMQEPLEALEVERELEPAEPPFYLMIRGYKDVDALWEKYKSDFEKLEIRINHFLKPMKIHTQSGKEAIVYEVTMNLDDIAELPIDYKKIITIEQDTEKGKKFGEKESFKQGLEH